MALALTASVQTRQARQASPTSVSQPETGNASGPMDTGTDQRSAARNAISTRGRAVQPAGDAALQNGPSDVFQGPRCDPPHAEEGRQENPEQSVLADRCDFCLRETSRDALETVWRYGFDYYACPDCAAYPPGIDAEIDQMRDA